MTAMLAQAATQAARRAPAPATAREADRRERDWERLTTPGLDAGRRLAVISGRRDLDAHAHVFHMADGTVPGARYAPSYDATMAMWSLHLMQAGLAGGTLVQVSFLGTDNSRMLAAMRTGRERGLLVTGSAVVPMEAGAGKMAAQMAALAREGVVSVRLNLMRLALPDLGSATWKRFTAAARGAGLAIEVHLEADRAASLVAAIIGEGCCVVVDHYGLAPDADALSAILGERDLDRVFVKASAPYRLPHGGNPAAHAARLRERAVATVGERNVMWGSDWPHTQHEVTFARSVAMNGGPGPL